MKNQNKIIALENKYCAQNYKPLPVIIARGEGIFLWDDAGKKYIDMMSAYSAVSFGHSHPKLVQALTDQAKQLAVVSRAFYTDRLGPFLQRLCELTGQDRALPMNTGAEAVETAIKAARKWGYTIKKIPEGCAEIIVCKNNFHGRTTTLISMSTEPQYRFGFSPYTSGFKVIPYGDSAALQQAITKNTAAFLVEPIQGEAGIVVPPAGYLQQCQMICQQHNVLLICDEVQTGLGRTGKLLASEHDNVKPDGLILGKALGGGLLPVSAFLAKEEVMNVFTPGDHGSTFGGNPLAATVGLTALNVLINENLISHSAELGDYLLQKLREINHPVIKDIRGKGLLIGIEIDKQKISAREICLQLMQQGILTKETHETVIRLAPPLIITQQQVDDVINIIKQVFTFFQDNEH